MTPDPTLPQEPDGTSIDAPGRERDQDVEAEGRLRDEVPGADERHRQELADAEAAAADRLRQARADERESDMAAMDTLVAAIRDLDDASTLSVVLDRLTTHAAGLVDGRAMTFIVKEGVLRRWKTAPAGATEPCAEIPLTGPSVAAVAARTREVATTRDEDGGRAVEPLACAPLDDARVGLAVPLRVGGETVAVLYADDVTDDEPIVPRAWPEAVEVLARHAASCLQVLTAARAYGLHAAVAGDGMASAGRRPTAGSDADGEGESAERYARLLVSEIKLYHEDAVMAGRRDANLLERLAPEIARARTLYDQRVPTEVRARHDYFGQELVRTLADGDRRLLGLDT